MTKVRVPNQSCDPIPFRLTTDGSSGAATYTGGTLNIPIYGGGASVDDGNATTWNGTGVDWGGTATSDITILGNNKALSFGTSLSKFSNITMDVTDGATVNHIDFSPTAFAVNLGVGKAAFQIVYNAASPTDTGGSFYSNFDGVEWGKGFGSGKLGVTIFTGTAGSITRLNIDRTGAWNLIADPGTAADVLNSKGPGLPPIWNSIAGILGYTPYNASNPSGYITGISGAMVNSALGYTPMPTFTLTTTGTSGAATLLSNVLNIPNYATGGGTWGSITGTITAQTDLVAYVASFTIGSFTTSTNGYVLAAGFAGGLLLSDNSFLADAATGNALLSGGSGSNPAYGKIGLTTHVSGILPVANGGTGTATPALIAGTGVSITGSWPNQTINSVAASSVIGDIYTDTLTSLANYSSTFSGGPSATAGGSGTTFTGGLGNYTNFIKRTSVKTSFAWMYHKVRFVSTVAVSGGTGEGLGIGWKGASALGFTNSLMASIDLTTGAAKGTVYIRDGAGTLLATSANKLSFTVNTDVIEIRFEYLHGQSKVTVKNITTGAAPVYVQYANSTILQTACVTSCSPAIWVIGGTQVASSDIWGTDYEKYPDLMIMGDSVWLGLTATSPGYTMGQLVAGSLAGKIIIYAAPNNGVDDLTNGAADVAIAAPKQLMFCEGINEGNVPTSLVNYMVKVANWVTMALAAGLDASKITLLYATPVSSSNATLNTAVANYNVNGLSATYAGIYTVNSTWTAPLYSGAFLATPLTTDGIHPNNGGYAAGAQGFSTTSLWTNIANVLPAPGADQQIIYNSNGSLTASTFFTGVVASGYIKIGANVGNNLAWIYSNYGGSGEIPAGVMYGSGDGSVGLVPTLNSQTNGVLTYASYYTNAGYKNAWEIASTTGASSGNLRLMKGGGTVTLGTTTPPSAGYALGIIGGVEITGNLSLAAAGNGIYIKEGSNATSGVATLSAGTVTVSTTKVTANSRIHLSIQSLGTVSLPTVVGVTARSAGTSFTITSASITDTSVVSWVIIEPA